MATPDATLTTLVDLVLQPGNIDSSALEKSFKATMQKVGKSFSDPEAKKALGEEVKNLKAVLAANLKQLREADDKYNKEVVALKEKKSKVKTAPTKKKYQDQIDAIEAERRANSKAISGLKSIQNTLIRDLSKIDNSLIVYAKQHQEVVKAYNSILSNPKGFDYAKLDAATKEQLKNYANLRETAAKKIIKIDEDFRKGLIGSRGLIIPTGAVGARDELAGARTVSGALTDRAAQGRAAKASAQAAAQARQAAQLQDAEGRAAAAAGDRENVLQERYKRKAEEARIRREKEAQSEALRQGIPGRVAGIQAAATGLQGQAGLVKSSEDLVRYRLAVKEFNTSINQLARDAKKVGADISGIAKPIEQVAIASKNASAAVGEVGLAGAFRRSAAAFARYAVIYGAGFAALNKTIEYAKGLVEYTDALKQLQAVAQATDNDMYTLSASIKNVAVTSASSLKDITKTAQILAQAGTATQELPAALQATTQFATATGSNPEVAADIVSSLAKVFPKQEIQSIADQLTSAVNVSKLTAENLQTITSLGAQTSKSIGASLQQFLGVSATLSNLGIKPQTVATGTRQLTLEIFSPDPATIAFLKKRYAALGENLSEEEIKAQFIAFKKAPNPYIAFLSELKRIGVSGEARDEFRRVIDVRAENALLPLIDNLDQVAKVTSKIGASGTAAEGAAVRADTLSVAMTQLGNSLLALGDNGTKGLQNLTKGVVQFLTGVSEAARGSGFIGKATSASLQAVTPFGAGIEALSRAFGKGGGSLEQAAGKQAEAQTEVQTLKSAQKQQAEEGKQRAESELKAAQDYSDALQRVFGADARRLQKVVDEFAPRSGSAGFEGNFTAALKGGGFKGNLSADDIKELVKAAASFSQAKGSSAGFVESARQAYGRAAEARNPNEQQRAALARINENPGLFKAGGIETPGELVELARLRKRYADEQFALDQKTIDEKEKQLNLLKEETARLQVRESLARDKTGKGIINQAGLLAGEGDVEGIKALNKVVGEEKGPGEVRKELLNLQLEAVKIQKQKNEADKQRIADEEAGNIQVQRQTAYAVFLRKKLDDELEATVKERLNAESSLTKIEQQIKAAYDTKSYDELNKLIEERARINRVLANAEQLKVDAELKQTYNKAFIGQTIEPSDLTDKQRLEIDKNDELRALYKKRLAEADKLTAIEAELSAEHARLKREQEETIANDRLRVQKEILDGNLLELKNAKGRGDDKEVIRLVDERIKAEFENIKLEHEQALAKAARGKRDNALADLQYKEALDNLAAEKEHLLQTYLSKQKAEKINKLMEKQAEKITRLTEAVSAAQARYEKAKDAVAAFETRRAGFKGTVEDARAAIAAGGAEGEPADARAAVETKLLNLSRQKQRGDLKGLDEGATKVIQDIVAGVQGGGISQFDAGSLLSQAEGFGKAGLGREGGEKYAELRNAKAHLENTTASLETAQTKMTSLQEQAKQLEAIKIGFDPNSLELMGQQMAALQQGWAPSGISKVDTQRNAELAASNIGTYESAATSYRQGAFNLGNTASQTDSAVEPGDNLTIVMGNRSHAAKMDKSNTESLRREALKYTSIY